LIGGYAVAYHGYVRATGDLDIFVECSSENAESITKACQSFGLGNTVTPDLFSESGNIVRFGLPPMRLEVLTEISGVNFKECWENRETLVVRNQHIPVICLKDLLENKKKSGRTKDKLDIEMLRGKG
jgi:hypothetical protein